MSSRLLAALLVLGTIAAGAAHRRLPPAAAYQDRAFFSARSELVVVYAMVTNARGSYVGNLPSSAFSILEDGQSQSIQFFHEQDAPVSVGLIIDSSGSMVPVRDRVIAAATTFAETSNPGDEMFALTFNERVTTALAPGEPFTSDPAMLRSALGRAFVTVGRTALYDAIAAGLAYVARGAYERRVLVVVSDGGDNASVAANFDGVLRQTQTTNTVIYTVALVDDVEPDANPRRLRAIAEASGGQAFEPRDVTKVEDVLRQISSDIRNTYTLGYVSTHPSHDGRFRGIRITARTPEGQSLAVRTRRGYVVEAGEDGGSKGRR